VRVPHRHMNDVVRSCISRKLNFKAAMTHRHAI
jgi:hypothetical protein